MILVLASVCFSACCSLQLVTFCESGHFRLEMSSSLHSPIIPFDFEQPTEEWVWTLQAVKCQERWTSIVQQVSLTEISRCDVRLSLFHPQNISLCISIWKIFLFVFTDTFHETQIVRHLYSMFGFVIPRRPVALVHGVLAEQPMTDGEAGLDSDWTLALRIGNGHEVFAHFTADRNTDSVKLWGRQTIKTHTHTHTHTHNVQLENSWTEAEKFARESAGSSI